MCELLNNADGDNMWDTRELEHIHCKITLYQFVREAISVQLSL
jgi:hypothetical protein